MLVSSIRFALLATVAATPLLATPAFAQDAFDLGEIIVSGGLSPIDAAKYGRAASIVTAKEIEDQGISTVQDALRALPGVSVSNSGASLGSVRIRGGESSHTLVLIDGIPASSGGAYTFSGLETANIERIEVLRGPQSATYGARAMTGVINIITRDAPLGQTASTSVEVGAGTTISTFLGQRTARGGLSLALSYGNDRGFDNSGDGGEKDGILRKSATVKGDFMATEDMKIGFSVRRAVEAFDYDGTSFVATDATGYIVDNPLLYTDRYETTARAFAEYSMMEGRLTHRLSFENTQLDQAQNGGTKDDTTTNAVKYRLSYGLDGAVADAAHLINLLIERQEDSSSSQPTFNPKATSIALEYRGSFAAGFDVQAGVRHDNNSAYEDTTTWNVGLSYTFAQSGIRLHSSAGTGVLNPRFDQLYDINYGPFTVFGNRDLKAEQNRSFDIGASFPVFGDKGSVDVTYFNETLTDKIEYDELANPNYRNATGKNKRQGLEIGGRLQATDALSLRMAYTYTDARNDKGAVEVRRPRNELSLGATFETFGGRGMVSADIRHVSGNFDTQFWLFPSPVVELPVFTTLDVAARYDLTERVSLTARVTNLFDKETTDTWGYANRGRAAYVGLNAKF